MRLSFSCSIALMILAALVSSAPVQSQSTTGCAAQQRKELILTVVDKDGSVIDNLRAEQLALKIGKSNATISDLVFHNNDQPLDLVVLIDASVSQEKALPHAKTGAYNLIRSVTTAGRDRVAIVSFSNVPSKTPVWASDFDAAVTAIRLITVDKPVGYVGGGVVVSASRPVGRDLPGSTALWDVMQSTAQELFSANPENRRRAMLLFSDGTDTSSRSKLDVVIENAIKYDIAIFSIGLADQMSGVTNEADLKKLAEQTGGVATVPKNKEAFETALSQITNRLRANYVIGYCGESKGKLQVEVTDPEIRKTKPILAYKRR